MRKPVYLDYAATTPVDPLVAEKMGTFLTLDGQFGNPASRSHRYGWQAEEAVDIARNQVADLIHADVREIVWTSGATESDNLAIKGVVAHYRERGRGCHIVTMATEHKAIIDTCRYLETQGCEVTYLRPEADGLLNIEHFIAALREETLIVSIMAVNNETGVIQDIETIGGLCRERGILFHVDAAQAAGKMALDVRRLKVDLMSFSAHKVYGPKGVGALYVRRSDKVQLAALIHGGGHERGMRSGTLATHQIVGMGTAFQLAADELAPESQRILQLKQRLWSGIQALEGIAINGNWDKSVPGILNVSFAGIEGETLLMSLHNLAISSGSACNSASVEPSYVLKAMGLSDPLADSSIRISIGRFSDEEEIDFAIEQITQVVTRLRAKT